MKKMLVVMMAVAMVFAMSAVSFATNTIQVTLTSPAIHKVGCERAGAVTYSFDANSVITVGDWWYFDLPSGVSLCKNVDYFLVANATEFSSASTVTVTDDSNRIVAFSACQGVGRSIGGAPLNPGENNGPFKVTNLGAGATAPTLVGNVALRVYGVSGTQRVWVYVYGDSPGSSVTVGPGTSFDIAIFDGQRYGTSILLNEDTKDVAGGRQSKLVWGDGTTSDAGADTIALDSAEKVPHVEDTLCVDATSYTSSLVPVSFDSYNSQFTFTGDSQIAHVAAANTITLAYCSGKESRATTGNILIGGQNECSFNYQTAAGYCSSFDGNRLFLQGTTTFGDPGDSYDMTVTSNTDGVYLAGTPTIHGFLPTDDKDCSATNTGVTVASNWTAYNEANTEDPGYPDSSCTISSTTTIYKVATSGGSISSIDTYDALWVQLPNLVYDTSVIGAGTEAEITISLDKYPCGTIFTTDVVIGTFVTDCGVSDTTTLLYPFLPPLDGSLAGWWGGFTIVNASTNAGTASLTFYEQDGDSATMTTSSIAAGGMYVADMSSLLSDVTPASTNTGTFGDSDVSIQVVCQFGKGGGFAFTGNGTEGTGYTAYVLGEDNAGVDRWQ